MSDHLGPVKPIKPKYQTPGKPWEPTIDSSDPSQKAAGEDYTAVYGGTPNQAGSDSTSTTPEKPEKSGNEPNLRMSYTKAPDIVPLPKSGSSADGPTAMESGRFYVNLYSLRSAEQTFLDATSQAVDGFDKLKDEVNKAVNDHNFFGQNVGKWVSTVNPGSSIGANGHRDWNPDPYNESAQQFADAITPQMKNLLNGIGSVFEAAGAFTALLTNAGQSYATMDANAAFTDE